MTKTSSTNGCLFGALFIMGLAVAVGSFLAYLRFGDDTALIWTYVGIFLTAPLIWTNITQAGKLHSKRPFAKRPYAAVTGLLGFLVGSGVILVTISYLSRPSPIPDDPPITADSNRSSNHSATPAFVKTDPEKSNRILREQLRKSENLAQQSAELIRSGHLSEARQLYKDRWNELATVRSNVRLDGDLSENEKENVDRALRGEQEEVTSILAKYDQLDIP